MVPFFTGFEKPIRHKPGLKNEKPSSLSLFSTLRALNHHNSVILAHLWPPFCLSWQADSKYV